MKIQIQKKGQQMVAGAIMVLTAAILIMISMLVVNKVRTSVHSDLYNDSWNTTSGEGKLEFQDTYDDVRSNASTAFSLSAIAIIVLVAFFIITILRG